MFDAYFAKSIARCDLYFSFCICQSFEQPLHEDIGCIPVNELLMKERPLLGNSRKDSRRRLTHTGVTILYTHAHLIGEACCFGRLYVKTLHEKSRRLGEDGGREKDATFGTLRGCQRNEKSQALLPSKVLLVGLDATETRHERRYAFGIEILEHNNHSRRCWRHTYTDDSIELVYGRFDGISIFQFVQTGQEQFSSNGIGDARRRDRHDGRHLSLFDLDVGPVTSVRFSCHVTGDADGEVLEAKRKELLSEDVKDRGGR